MLTDDIDRLECALRGVYRLALGGTAVGTGISAAPGFGEATAARIATLTGLPFVSASNKFAVQGAHDAHYALDNDLTLKQAATKLGFATEEQFDRVVDPAKMVYPLLQRERMQAQWARLLGSPQQTIKTPRLRRPSRPGEANYVARPTRAAKTIYIRHRRDPHLYCR